MFLSNEASKSPHRLIGVIMSDFKDPRARKVGNGCVSKKLQN